MSMQAKQRQLNIVLKLAQDKEAKYQRDFLQAQHHLNDSRAKLNGLSDFRLDYMKQLQNKASAGVTGDSLNHFHAFIGRLEAAMEEQTRQVDTATQVVEQRNKLWLAQRARTKAIEKLIEKRQLLRQAQLNKQEQNLLDEFAAQAFIRR